MTQPTLTRRHFIAATIAAILAGPRALAALLEQHRRRPAMVFSIDFPYSYVVRSRPNMVIWSRGVQADFEKMLAYEAKEWHHFDRINPRAPSGYRAWSQSHPA